MKILVCGANGQLGTELVTVLSEDFEVVGVGRDILDVTDFISVLSCVQDIKPDIIINSAACTNVDGCETKEDLAYKVNGLGARNLAVVAEKNNIKLLHVSTDFVFDGETKDEYIEFDIPNPQSVYGKSKLAGEEFIKNHCNKYFIIRTSWLYGHNGGNFVKTMLQLAKSRESLSVVSDQVGTPTYTKDLVEVIRMLVETEAYGIYHFSNDGKCSWNQFATRIFELTCNDIEVLGISTEDYGAPAPRPKYSVMRNYMLELQFGYKARHWEDALCDYLMINK